MEEIMSDNVYSVKSRYVSGIRQTGDHTVKEGNSQLSNELVRLLMIECSCCEEPWPVSDSIIDYNGSPEPLIFCSFGCGELFWEILISRVSIFNGDTLEDYVKNRDWYSLMLEAGNE